MLQKTDSTSLTHKLYRAEQVRLHEQAAAADHAIDMYLLMRKAGETVFEQCLAYFPNVDNYLVLVGIGNNAGDAYIAALQAKLAGKNVVLCAVEPDRDVHGEAALAKTAWLDSGGVVSQFDAAILPKADVIIDGLLGTGINGTLRKEFADIIDAVNLANTPVISIDVPSGLDADTGESLGRCIQADVTVTFVGIKMGLSTGAGKQSCGELVFKDLGIAKAFNERARSDAKVLDIAHFKGLSPRPINSHKGSYGRLLCIGGNIGMSGAIRLSAEAALRMGTGLVKVFAHSDSKVQICSGRPELMVISDDLEAALEWATCIVVGPGLGQNEWSKSVFECVMNFVQCSPKPIVIDADALNLKAVNTSFVALPDCVMTPHAGEAARLLNVTVDEVESNRFNYARQCAQRYDAVCVLKGAGSIVDNQKHAWVCRHGNPGMATAGMGDVLTGILGALMAQGLDSHLACQYGVSLHAKAGDMIADKYGQRGLLASDLFETIRVLVNQ
ncbi:NAD(P)H-hydrate dehydratase [Agaribacter flavus]|uniref:Bifunctional NAD(P)H-hydrate repair enzyme n=1 Tax=Agaribacter flavus TaxID=1902781 RepID=A0ABV7FPR2_9ALTE